MLTMEARLFNSWFPGKVCSQRRITILNLNYEYIMSLERAIDNNTPLLAKHLNVDPNPLAIKNKLFSYSPEDLKRQINERINAPKSVWAIDSRYSTFLQHLYSNKLNVPKLISAIEELPSGRDKNKTRYIEPNHLEKLISRSMSDSSLFLYVYNLIHEDNLPTTVREDAHYIQNTFLKYHKSNNPLLKNKWRHLLAEQWSTIASAKDTGAFNILLKLGYLANCKDTVNLIKHHMVCPDRFTYLLRLRFEKDKPPQSIFQEFSSKGHIADNIFTTTYIISLLKDSSIETQEYGEKLFNYTLKETAGRKAITTNAHHFAVTVKALDKLNQLCGNNTNFALDYGIPQVADSKMFDAMYMHYITAKNIPAAWEVLKSMVSHGHVPKRSIILKTMKKLTFLEDPESIKHLEKLYFICCEANFRHPGFISDSFANMWCKTISMKSNLSATEVTDIMNKNRYAVKIEN